MIYDAEQACDGLYVIILGRVKITSVADDGLETVSRIVSVDDFFGESSLVGAEKRQESAVALDKVSVMAWTRAEIERHIEHEPRLGIALSQRLVSQCIELQDRIESMAMYKTAERVMLALIQLAGSLGTPLADGWTSMASLTHHTLAGYVGTSREIITFQMNWLRRQGMLRYSRKSIDIFVAAVEGALRSRGVALPRPAAAVAHQASR